MIFLRCWLATWWTLAIIIFAMLDSADSDNDGLADSIAGGVCLGGVIATALWSIVLAWVWAIP